MKIKAVITGPAVQGVGYRVFLMHEAVIEGIERFAALNVSDDTVVVLAEADEDAISNFKAWILISLPFSISRLLSSIPRRTSDPPGTIVVGPIFGIFVIIN